MMITPEIYREVRARLAALGHVGDWEWSQSLKPCTSAPAFACEYVWVVLNSGMKNTVARGIMNKVWPRLVGDEPIAPVFGHRGKVAAIELVWRDRGLHFAAFLGAQHQSAAAVVAWCQTLPWIGAITKYHLAKNLGVDCAKPDRWLVRLAEAEGESVDGLCARLAAATGDRIATVDVVLWRACAVGVLVMDNSRIRIGDQECPSTSAAAR